MTRFTVFIVLMILLVGCGRSKTPTNRLAVPVAPYRSILTSLAGDDYSVEVLIPAGREPHDFGPTPSQLRDLSQVTVYFQLGMPFEETMIPKLRSINPKLRVIDLRQGLTLRPNDQPFLSVGSGESDPDDFEGKDPHIWLAPGLLTIQARTMTDALEALAPEKKDRFEANFVTVKARLTDAGDSVRTALDGLSQRKLLVFHPAWGYFCDEFDLRQIPIEIRGKTPSARELGLIIGLARKEGITTVFAEQQFSTREAQTVADALHGKVVMLDPMREDVFANLSDIARAIRGNLAK
jgi:zinc transport system substrate-binding protein